MDHYQSIMDPLISAYSSTLKARCPALGQTFDQVINIRTASSYPDYYVQFDLETDDARDLSKRVNSSINRQKQLSLPSSWCPLGLPSRTPVKFSGDTCQTHQSIAKLLPNLSWYDPAHPMRGGWVLAGSAARPTMNHRSLSIGTFDHRYSPLGICEVHAEVKEVHLPEHSSDIDLFLVVGGDDDDVREMIGRAHIQDVMVNSSKNPMNALMSDGTPCGICGRETPRTYMGRCTSCTMGYGCRDKINPYTYAAKHVVSYTVGGCFDIQFITRVYKDVDLIVPRFDMTVDGAIFSPKMGLRVLPIALQEWRNGIAVLSPFSGSSTMNERVYKKMQRYNIVPIIPGYVEDMSRKGIVYAITAAKTVVPGIHRKALIASCKKLPMEYRESVASLWHCNVCTRGLFKRIRTIELLKKQLLEDDDIENTCEYDFSRTKECITYVIPDTGVSILTDRQESSGSSGSFQALTIEETMLQLSFHSNPPKITTPPEPSTIKHDDIAAVLVPVGDMDKATLKKVKRGLSAFVYHSQPVFMNNLLVNKGALGVTGLSYVLVGTSKVHNTFEIAIAGDSFLHCQNSKMGAQVWTVRVKSITDAPALMCISNTGLYQKGAYVCMGAQSHFHEGANDPLAMGVHFSLPALIVSITDRAKVLMDRDVDHINSVGILDELHTDEAVVKHHELAYADLNNDVHEWVYKIEL